MTATDDMNGYDARKREQVFNRMFRRCQIVNVKEKAALATDSMVRFKGDTAEGGKIVLCEYPEGFILRHHGEVVWREWSKE